MKEAIEKAVSQSAELGDAERRKLIIMAISGIMVWPSALQN